MRNNQPIIAVERVQEFLNEAKRRYPDFEPVFQTREGLEGLEYSLHFRYKYSPRLLRSTRFPQTEQWWPAEMFEMHLGGVNEFEWVFQMWPDQNNLSHGFYPKLTRKEKAALILVLLMLYSTGGTLLFASEPWLSILLVLNMVVLSWVLPVVAFQDETVQHRRMTFD